MPCNESGPHSPEEALRYGMVTYDWSNMKNIWVNDKPMHNEDYLVDIVERVMAADKNKTTRLGVYRNTIKALPWFASVREKLEDPKYEGWFFKFKGYNGPSSNHSFSPSACTYEKCSGFWHDQAGTMEHPGVCKAECDCGQVPCGGYVFDHRNSSFSEWFINEYIINSKTILHEGVTEMYLDDRVELWGIAEAEGNFINDSGVSSDDMKDLKAAFNANMERLYDRMIELGSFSWQMLGPAPRLVPFYFQNGTMRADTALTPDACTQLLREYCRPNGTAEQRFLAYINNPYVDNATIAAEQYTASFLLTRGPFAWIGYGWRNPGTSFYPRPSQWDEDFGVPLEACSEASTGIFQRKWSKASVDWDCHLGTGRIHRDELVGILV